MKKFFVAFFMMFTIFAYGEGFSSLDVSKSGFEDLPKEQQAVILQQIAQASQQVKQTTPEQVNQWLDVGNNIGLMLTGAAKQVGIAVGEFLNTPIGKWTVVIAVVYMFGGNAIAVCASFLVFIVGIKVLKTFMDSDGRTITYDVDKRDIFGRSVKASERKPELDGEEKVMMFIGFLCITGVSLVVYGVLT